MMVLLLLVLGNVLCLGYIAIQIVPHDLQLIFFIAAFLQCATLVQMFDMHSRHLMALKWFATHIRIDRHSVPSQTPKEIERWLK